MAPEIMARQARAAAPCAPQRVTAYTLQAYNQSADVWSCGVILFVLLCGFPPYEGTQNANGRPDYAKTLQKIQQRCDAEGRFNYFPDPYWSSISKSAQDLIRSMVPPPLRPSVSRLLAPLFSACARLPLYKSFIFCPKNHSRFPLSTNPCRRWCWTPPSVSLPTRA